MKGRIRRWRTTDQPSLKISLAPPSKGGMAMRYSTGTACGIATAIVLSMLCDDALAAPNAAACYLTNDSRRAPTVTVTLKQPATLVRTSDPITVEWQAARPIDLA